MNEDGGIKCRYCRGTGVNEIDGGRLTFRCPDCDGTGILHPEPEDVEHDDQQE